MIDFEKGGSHSVEFSEAVSGLNLVLKVPGSEFSYLSLFKSIISGKVIELDEETGLPLVYVREENEDGTSFGATGLFMGSFADRTHTVIAAPDVLPGSDLAFMRKRDRSLVNFAAPIGNIAIQMPVRESLPLAA